VASSSSATATKQRQQPEVCVGGAPAAAVSSTSSSSSTRDASGVGCASAYEEYAIEWVAISATPNWVVLSLDARVRINASVIGVYSTAAEMARDTLRLLAQIDDSLTAPGASGVDVILPGALIADKVIPPPQACLLRGIVAEQQKRQRSASSSLRHICVVGGVGGVPDTLLLPPASAEPEVLIRGAEVFVPRLTLRQRRCRSLARRNVQNEEEDTQLCKESSCYLVVVDSLADIAPGGIAAAAIQTLASRSHCQSIAVWTPAALNPAGRCTLHPCIDAALAPNLCM